MVLSREEINAKAREAYARRKAANPDAVREYQREQTARNRRNNPDTHKQARRRHYVKNRDEILAKNRQYADENWEILKPKKAEAKRRRRIESLEVKIAGNLRARLGRAIRGESRPGSAVKDLGCTVAELKAHLESQFQPGMSWENYGRRGWHIDHIEPLSSFDLLDEEQFLKACRFTNLQPLWGRDNLVKGAKRLEVVVS